MVSEATHIFRQFTKFYDISYKEEISNFNTKVTQRFTGDIAQPETQIPQEAKKQVIDCSFRTIKLQDEEP